MTKKKPTPTPKPRTAPPPKPPCEVEGCGRPAYSGGLCQTHHRRRKLGLPLEPIRPYRKRSPDTTKFAGLRLSPLCVDRIKRRAEKRGLSYGAAIADILERWYEEGARPVPPAPNGSGARKRRR